MSVSVMVSMSKRKEIQVAADAPAMANWVSSASRHRFAQAVAGVSTPALDIAGLRLHYAKLNQERLDLAMGQFDVTVESANIAGIAVHRCKKGRTAYNHPERRRFRLASSGC